MTKLPTLALFPFDGLPVLIVADGTVIRGDGGQKATVTDTWAVVHRDVLYCTREHYDALQQECVAERLAETEAGS